jgi:hypothetical protein
MTYLISSPQTYLRDDLNTGVIVVAMEWTGPFVFVDCHLDRINRHQLA